MASVGQILVERYRLDELLGRGGFGTTFAAVDLTSDAPVAVKLLEMRAVEDWKSVELFEREAAVLAALDHPSIPRYRDHFALPDGDLVLVQSRVEGQDLLRALEGGARFDEAGVSGLAAQVLRVLEYLHGLRPPVFHRDLKPSNLLRDDAGDIFLVDFGSVRDTVRGASSVASSVVGTYGYMAPEQFQGRAVPGSDLYGLGATIAHLLTGARPSELPHNRLKIDLSQVRDLTLTPAFRRWLERMLEPLSEDRFASAFEAREALVSGGLAQTAVARRPPARVAHRRSRRGAAASRTSLEIARTEHEFSSRIARPYAGAYAFIFSGALVAFAAGAVFTDSAIWAAAATIPWALGAAVWAAGARERGAPAEALLRIDDTRVALETSLLGRRKTVEFPTDELRSARVSQPRVRDGVLLATRRPAVVLETERGDVRLGANLSSGQRRKLARTINDHLAALRR